MQTGPITKRGKAKSSKNAITHGLSSTRLISDDEKALYDQTVKSLNDEYQPQTFTEQILVERTATHYVRLVRATNAEAACIERENISFTNNLPIQEIFGLSDDQTKAYALAYSKGQLTCSDDDEKTNQLAAEAVFHDIINIISQGGLHDLEILNNTERALGLVFTCMADNGICSIEELFDGRFTPEQLIQSALDFGKESPGHYPGNQSLRSKSIKPYLLLEDLQKQIGELVIARHIHPQVKKLEQLTEHLGAALATDLDKVNRHLTNADRQFSKALGELRHVITERKRQEAINPAA